MKDGTHDNPPSAVRRVAELRNGETYSRARFIPAIRVTPTEIKTAKRELSRALSPVIARAQELSFGLYHLHTIHSHTRNYDVVVAAVVIRQTE